MPSNCVFELNKPQSIYFSGETISGTIYLTTTKRKNVRDICIIFLGEGNVNWTESRKERHHDGISITSTSYYSSHEVYVNNCTYVYGDGVLPAGQHIYTFIIPLPLECPSSLESKYGHIRYDITLKINRYYHFDNIYKKPVTILKTFDLNLDPTFKLPAEAEVIKSLCCWPCSRGKIMCSLIVPFGAYVPKQMLRYSLQINNQSMSDIESFLIEFIKKITFTAKTPKHKQRHIKEVLFSKNTAQTILRQSNRVIKGEFPIPPTISTTFKYETICVEYKLKVILHLPTCSSNTKISVPIIIGTTPIRESLAIAPLIGNSLQLQVAQTTEGVKGADVQNLPPNYKETIKQALSTSEKTTTSVPILVKNDVDEKSLLDFKRLN